MVQEKVTAFCWQPRSMNDLRDILDSLVCNTPEFDTRVCINGDAVLNDNFTFDANLTRFYILCKGSAEDESVRKAAMGGLYRRLAIQTLHYMLVYMWNVKRWIANSNAQTVAQRYSVALAVSKWQNTNHVDRLNDYYKPVVVNGKVTKQPSDHALLRATDIVAKKGMASFKNKTESGYDMLKDFYLFADWFTHRFGIPYTFKQVIAEYFGHANSERDYYLHIAWPDEMYFPAKETVSWMYDMQAPNNGGHVADTSNFKSPYLKADIERYSSAAMSRWDLGYLVLNSPVAFCRLVSLFDPVVVTKLYQQDLESKNFKRVASSEVASAIVWSRVAFKDGDEGNNSIRAQFSKLYSDYLTLLSSHNPDLDLGFTMSTALGLDKKEHLGSDVVIKKFSDLPEKEVSRLQKDVEVKD